MKCHIKNCFKINVKQRVEIPKKGDYVKLKKYEKTKVTIYDLCIFPKFLVPEDNGKQNPNAFYTNKYQKFLACGNGYKLVCVDDKFSKSFKSYLDEDAVYSLERTDVY